MGEKLGKEFENIGDQEAGLIMKQEALGGMEIEELPTGKTLIVQTKNRPYKIERRDDGFYISGNPKYCPEPVKANIHGSTFGGSMLKIGYIGRDMHLEYSILGKEDSFITSSIKDLYIEGEEREKSPEDTE